jgi:ATP-dependent Clp protease ATP-binding subunit ClpB
MSILEKLTNQMQGTIESGVSLALHNKNQEVDPIHLIWALLTNSGSILHQALNKMNADKAAIELDAKSIANNAKSGTFTAKCRGCNDCKW